jgi:hypothetical protein
MTCDQSLLMPKAAVNYQQNVLNAWQKIDDALSACAADSIKPSTCRRMCATSTN